MAVKCLTQFELSCWIFLSHSNREKKSTAAHSHLKHLLNCSSQIALEQNCSPKSQSFLTNASSTAHHGFGGWFRVFGCGVFWGFVSFSCWGLCVLFRFWGFFPLNLFLKKVSSCYYKMTNILYTLSLHQKLQKAQQVSQPIHLLPTADTVLYNAHFWWPAWRRGFPRNKLNKASCSAEAGNVLQCCLAHKEWKILTKQNSRRWSVNWIVLPSCRQIESHTSHPPSSLALMCLNLEKIIHAYVYMFCMNIKWLCCAFKTKHNNNAN